jgi:hypothetical protein
MKKKMVGELCRIYKTIPSDGISPTGIVSHGEIGAQAEKVGNVVYYPQ